jgi:hypothetical protein
MEEPVKLQARRRMLREAVHDAALELARRAESARYAPAQPDNNSPTPDDIRTAAVSIENRRGETNLDIAATDELWVAYAINTVTGARHAGLGQTAGEAKASAWINSHWPDGAVSEVRVQVSTEVPEGWTFELYAPPKPKPKMLAISTLAIFELVRLTIPDITPDEVENTIVQSLPYMGGPRQ